MVLPGLELLQGDVPVHPILAVPCGIPRDIQQVLWDSQVGWMLRWWFVDNEIAHVSPEGCLRNHRALSCESGRLLLEVEESDPM